MNCYEESIRQVLDEYKTTLPDEAIADIIGAIDACNEYASYSIGGYEPQKEEIRKLKEALERERGKVICNECKGKGQIVMRGPYHSSISSCSNCCGIGFIYTS